MFDRSFVEVFAKSWAAAAKQSNQPSSAAHVHAPSAALSPLPLRWSACRCPMGAMGSDTHTPIVCLRLHLHSGSEAGRGVARSIEAIAPPSLPRQLSLSLSLSPSSSPLPIVSALFSFLFYFRRRRRRHRMHH